MASIPSSELLAARSIGDPTDVMVDGLTPDRVVGPGTGEEAAQLLAEAQAGGFAVTPVGGGTALSLGNVPKRIDLALSTRKIAGIDAYEPTDLTLSVRAGTPFAEVQAILGERGQTLPIDVARPDVATIGGIIATGIIGPRRSGSPTVRDLLIGISAAHPSGHVTKAGGMVVKNVSGFDLMRLYLGSLGTLGVVVSANFKVLPRARHEATLIAEFDDAKSALAAAERIHQSRIRPVSLEVFADQRSWRVALRIEGRETTVKLLADEAAAVLRTDGTRVEGRDSADWWQRYTDAQAVEPVPNAALIRAAARPRAIADLTSNLVDRISMGSETEQLAVTPGVGQITLRVRYPGEETRRGQFLELWSWLLGAADNAAVLAAPPEWKQEIDVWGGAPETIDVMRALKEQFDPKGVLNPGRFAGRM